MHLTLEQIADGLIDGQTTKDAVALAVLATRALGALESIAESLQKIAQAQGHGFDTKVLRKVVALRKLDKADRQEQESVLDLYLSALGMRA